MNVSKTKLRNVSIKVQEVQEVQEVLQYEH